MSLFGAAGSRSAAPQTGRLRESVRRLLDLDEETSVVVRQLDCTEPGCPPVETVIAVLAPGAAVRRWTVPNPAAEITERALHALFTTAPDGEVHH